MAGLPADLLDFADRFRLASNLAFKVEVPPVHRIECGCCLLGDVLEVDNLTLQLRNAGCLVVGELDQVDLLLGVSLL